VGGGAPRSGRITPGKILSLVMLLASYVHFRMVWESVETPPADPIRSPAAKRFWCICGLKIRFGKRLSSLRGPGEARPPNVLLYILR